MRDHQFFFPVQLLLQKLVCCFSFELRRFPAIGMVMYMICVTVDFLKRSGCVERFSDVFFFRAKKAEFLHFRLLHFFGIFLLFRVPACSGAVCVRTCVLKSLVSGSASVFNVFWQGWIVVAYFCRLRAQRIFDFSRFFSAAAC